MNRNQSNVMLITGRTGVGKSTLLDRFAKKHKGAIQLLRPKNLSGDVFDISAVDWQSHAAVVVDELGNWDRPSIQSAIGALESMANENGKKLVLVCLFATDLDLFGLALKRQPFVFELQSPNNVASLPLKFDGIHLNFKEAPVEALPFDLHKASAGFPDGWDSSVGRYSSQYEVNEFLKGKRINAVEFTNHNTIKFMLDGGLAISLTPSGIEGDALDLLVEKPDSI